jgi:tRNA dimethylallyltransferase
VAELVIGLFGPTASGKSDVAAAVADLVPADVISADSMQVYDGLPILTNRSPHRERLVGIWPLSQEASVGAYAPLAHDAVDEAFAAQRTPLVVGGTGLYFRAALAELELPPAPPEGAREKWSRLYDEKGSDAAHATLRELDPVAADRVHPNDRRRVVRALELADAGTSLVPRDDRLFGGGWRYPTLVVGLVVPKAVLEERIAARTHRMFDLGVEDEVHAALSAPLSATARKVIGLNEIATLPREDAIEALAARTRQYAAYQRKWMRSLEGVVMVDADRPAEETAAEIVELARAREHLSRP